MQTCSFQGPAYDVVIVGARCAGAATAMLLARAGARVIALDRGTYGSDTLSTHALMRPAVMQLARWGILHGLLRAGTPVMTETVFHYGQDEVRIPIRPAADLPGLIAPRRTLLDRSLVDAARAAGADIHHDTVVQDLVRAPDRRVVGVQVKGLDGISRILRAQIVIGADGLGSLVARKCGAAIIRRGTTAAAHIYAYSPFDAGAAYRWYFNRGASASFIPTNDAMACVVASVPQERFDRELRFDPAEGRLAVLHGLSQDLAEKARQGGAEVKVFRGAPGILRQAHGPGWALVGDAGFFRDPLTSHGVSDAFRDAEGLVQAILAGSSSALQRFQTERDEAAIPILEATDSLASFDWALSDLGDRHMRFSQAMKAELELIGRRMAEERTREHMKPESWQLPAKRQAA